QQVGARVGTDVLENLEAVEPGQLEVEQHDLGEVARVAPGVGAGREQEVERLGAVTRHLDVVADLVLAEGAQGQLDVVGVVLDQQDEAIAHGVSPDGSSVKVKVAPRPVAPSARMRPPWRWTMRWTMARPMPLPGNSSTRCRRWKAPNSLAA